jgi:hypothetical protein
LVVEVIAQPIKPTKVPLKYSCIICSSFEPHAPNCLRKTNDQNMFQTKPTTTTTIVSKPFKFDNVPINVVVVIMTCNQVPEQQVFRECELMKAKVATNW